jgi:hypothetical protein
MMPIQELATHYTSLSPQQSLLASVIYYVELLNLFLLVFLVFLFFLFVHWFKVFFVNV